MNSKLLITIILCVSYSATAFADISGQFCNGNEDPVNLQANLQEGSAKITYNGSPLGKEQIQLPSQSCIHFSGPVSIKDRQYINVSVGHINKNPKDVWYGIACAISGGGKGNAGVWGIHTCNQYPSGHSGKGSCYAYFQQDKGTKGQPNFKVLCVAGHNAPTPPAGFSQVTW